MAKGIREEDETQGDLFVSSSGRPAAGNSVIPFRRAQSRRVGSSDLEAGGSPSPASNFIQLGEAADAVIMRLRQRLPRIVVKVARADPGEE